METAAAEEAIYVVDLLGQMIIRECNSADPELVPLRRTKRNSSTAT